MLCWPPRRKRTCKCGGMWMPSLFRCVAQQDISTLRREVCWPVMFPSATSSVSHEVGEGEQLLPAMPCRDFPRSDKGKHVNIKFIGTAGSCGLPLSDV